MASDRDQLNKLLDRYDDLAVNVVEDERPNTARGLPYSNSDMTQMILEALDWESFDLFHTIDFEAAFKSDEEDYVRAYCFLAYLRLDLFTVSMAAGVGDPDFNKAAASTSEYWFRRLMDRFTTLNSKQDTETKHNWIH